jgi:hypothetical protein
VHAAVVVAGMTAVKNDARLHEAVVSPVCDDPAIAKRCLIKENSI